MSAVTSHEQQRMLFSQLRWLLRLRWLAGLAVLVGSLVDALYLHWYPHTKWLAAVGAGILLYNAMLHAGVRRPARKRYSAVGMAWTQLVLDLACLTLVVLATGGTASPALGLFVLHMVFASLLLSAVTAYGAAVLAVGMVAVGLEIIGGWPMTIYGNLMLVGWALTLVLTVYLTNHITLSLRRHRHRLLHQTQRSRALATQLRQQQQTMIQHEKTVAMGQMAAGVAHEIANPLASMDSVLQLMQRHDRHVTPANVTALRQQVERIRQIVHQLTDFAHPTEYTWQNVPINELVRMGLEMVRFDRRHKQVAIARELIGDGCLVRVQPHAVQQVLINVLLNALDAVADVPEPHITLVTQCAGESEGGGRLCRISVRDNGCGIAPEKLARVFEPFFTTKPVGKGTGLGLAISQSLIRNQGGDIQIDSVVGQGTSVHILLPKGEE